MFIEQFDVGSDVRPTRIADPIVFPLKAQIVDAPSFLMDQPVQYTLADMFLGCGWHLISAN